MDYREIFYEEFSGGMQLRESSHSTATSSGCSISPFKWMLTILFPGNQYRVDDMMVQHAEPGHFFPSRIQEADPSELQVPHCFFTASRPILKYTKHFSATADSDLGLLDYCTCTGSATTKVMVLLVNHPRPGFALGIGSERNAPS